jgi:hypothetical protein
VGVGVGEREREREEDHMPFEEGGAATLPCGRSREEGLGAGEGARELGEEGEELLTGEAERLAASAAARREALLARQAAVAAAVRARRASRFPR